MTPQRLSDFLPLAVQSLTQPRVGFRTIRDIPTTRTDLINAAWFVIVCNLFLTTLLVLIGPPPPEGAPDAIPLTTSAIIQALSLFGGAILAHQVGKLFKGVGNFDDSLKMVVWINFILLLIQIPMMFVAILGPQVLPLAMMLVMIIAMTQLTAQVMELHGFTQVFPVLIGIIGTMIGFGIILLIVLGILGVSLPLEPPA